MHGSSANRDAAERSGRSRSPRAGTLEDPLGPVLQHLQASVQELHAAQEQLARHGEELEQMHVQAETVRGRCQQHEERHRQLLEILPDGLIVHRDGQILYANPAAAEILGVADRARLIGTSILDFIHGDSREVVQRCLEGTTAGTGLPPHEQRLVRLDGTDICVEVTGTPMIYDDQPAGQLLFRDITERKRLQSEIIAISEMERGRIGRDLHDVLGQNLTAIAFLAKGLERQLQQAGRAEAAGVREICDLAAEGMRQTRILARGLSPIELEANQLIAMITTLTMDCQHTFQMACHFEPPDEPNLPIDSGVATHLYHIAQEAITNAFRHGKARNAYLRLHVEEGNLVLTIRDDGAGFALEEKPHGIGLRIMNHRAGLLGGTLKVESRLGQGTTVTCTVPITHPEQ